MPDIFLSYSREDVAHARRLATALEAEGWDVWWDPLIPAGRTFDEVIDEALDAARCVVVLWSAASVRSRYVRGEVADAADRGILIPVVLDPEVRIPRAFRAIQAADLGGWEGRKTEQRYRQLVGDLVRLLGDPGASTAGETEPAPASSSPPPEEAAVEPEAAASDAETVAAPDSAFVDGAADGGATVSGRAANARAPLSTRVEGPPQPAGTGDPTKPAERPRPEKGRSARRLVGWLFAPGTTAPRLSNYAMLGAAALATGLMTFQVGSARRGGVSEPPSRAEAGSERGLPVATASPVSVIRLDAPPFEDVPVTQPAGGADLALRVVSSARNQITDDEAWFERIGLSLPVVEPDRIPAWIAAERQGLRRLEVIRSGSRLLAIYGASFSEGTLLVAHDAAGDLEYALDFSAYARPPRIAAGDERFVDIGISWAQHVGSVVYVSWGHPTYAASSFGMNAYVTALDPRTGEALWHSAPLVANSGNFEVVDDYLVTGYGFSGEPDFLYLLDRRDGVAVARVGLVTAADYILRRDDRLYVRTYDTDYVFAIEPAAAGTVS